MRRPVRKRPRRSSAAVLAVVTACIMWSTVAGASADENSSTLNHETALAIPRVRLPGSTAEITLPTPLSSADAALARRAFVDLDSGRVADAERERASLDSHLLDGCIRADLYLGPYHRSTVPELEGWLKSYGDQPDAAAIRDLLRKRLPRGAQMPPGDPPAMLAPEPTPADNQAQPSLGTRDLNLSPWLRADVSRLLKGQKYQSALRATAPHASAHAGAAALLRSEVARALFVNNWDAEAQQVAAAAWEAASAADRTGRGALVAGLASWRLGEIGKAGTWFQRAADAKDAPAEIAAAGAFWAARAALRAHDADGYKTWLRRAGTERRTFYGLIARRILGWGTGLILGRDLLSEADMDALSELKGGERAFALIQIGQTSRAEAQLRALWPLVSDSAPLRRALLLVAATAHMTDLASQLAALVQADDGVPHDALLFPVPRLTPAGGFIIDPALVYGLTRTESGFRPDAVSPAGARGLMQIMPITARAVSHIPRISVAYLDNPSENLGLGQRVLIDIANDRAVQDDLIRLLAAYNDGVGGFATWDGDIRDPGNDPFLYIEAIPVPETRRFVQRVLANTWIYAARLGLPAPSLDALASGRDPTVGPELAPPGGMIRTALRTVSLTALP